MRGGVTSALTFPIYNHHHPRLNAYTNMRAQTNIKVYIFVLDKYFNSNRTPQSYVPFTWNQPWVKIQEEVYSGPVMAHHNIKLIVIWRGVGNDDVIILLFAKTMKWLRKKAQKCFTFFPFLAAFPSSSHFEQRFVFIFSSYAEALAAEKTGGQVVLDQVQIAHPP